MGGPPLIGKHPLANGAYDESQGEYRADPNYNQAGPLVGSDNLVYSIQLPKGLDPAKVSVTATIYSQSLMPVWLHQRFEQAAWAVGDHSRQIHCVDVFRFVQLAG